MRVPAPRRHRGLGVSPTRGSRWRCKQRRWPLLIQLVSGNPALICRRRRLSCHAAARISTTTSAPAFAHGLTLVHLDSHARRPEARHPWAVSKQGAHAFTPHLFGLTRQPTGHGTSLRVSVWPFPAVPALSLTSLCSQMLAGASAASSMTGSVVEDVETVIGASSVATFALELTIASACA